VKLAGLSPRELRSSLRRGELILPFGPVLARVVADEAGFAEVFHRLYAAWDALPAAGTVADLTLYLRRLDLRTWGWIVDGGSPRRTFTREMTQANFEWAMHLALAGALAPNVSVHAAVAVRPDGRAVALVGRSGAGKSTLAAGLSAAGWALAADEFLVVQRGGALLPVPAVITLKGRSIDLIRDRSGGLGVFGPVVVDPLRGPIAHYAAPRLVSDGAAFDLRAIAFPRYEPDEEPMVRPIARGEAILRLGRQSHNLHLAGPDGLRLIASLARRPVYAIRYGSLDAAIAQVNDLLDAP
jgi:HprK-related kinase A